MHWIIQKNIFKPDNYQLLIDALNAANIKYTSIFIPANTLNLEPEINLTGKIYICGAIKLTKIAKERKWIPGSFLNDQFKYNIWIDKLGDELINSDSKMENCLIFKQINFQIFLFVHWKIIKYLME